MSYDTDLAKEYLRDRFHEGALDVSCGYLSLRGFVQIFSGEMEALIAIEQASWLENDDDFQVKLQELLSLAGINENSISELEIWKARIHS